MKQKIIIVLLLCFLLQSCAEAPKKESPDNGLKEWREEDIYVSPDEAKRQLSEIEANGYAGLTLSSHFNMSDFSEIGVYTFSGVKSDNPTYSKDWLMELWSGADSFFASELREEKYCFDDGTCYGVAYFSENEACSFEWEGFMYGEGLIIDGEPELVKAYDFLWGDEAGEDEYELSDGTMKIKDAVSFVEEKLNSCSMKETEGVGQYKVQHLYVLKTDGNDFCDYKMKVGRILENVPMDTAGRYYCFDNATKYHVEGSELDVVMRKCSSIDEISNENGVFVFDKIESHDKLISPKYAMDKIKNEITLVGIDSFEQHGLVYLRLLLNDEYIDENGNKPTEEEMLSVPIYVRPYWMFMNKNESQNCGNWDAHRDICLVDAIDGTVYYYDVNNVRP